MIRTASTASVEPPQRRASRDRRIHREAEAPGPLGALIVGRLLVDVQGHDVHRGPVPAPFPRIADQESVAHVLGVRQVVPDRRDDRQLLPGLVWPSSLICACFGGPCLMSAAPDRPSASPEGGFPRRLVPDAAQVGRLDPLLTAVQRVDGRREDSGRQQGALDRVGRLSGQEQGLDVMGQRVEEVRAASARARGRPGTSASRAAGFLRRSAGRP